MFYWAAVDVTFSFGKYFTVFKEIFNITGEVEQRRQAERRHYLDREQPPYYSDGGTNHQVGF